MSTILRTALKATILPIVALQLQGKVGGDIYVFGQIERESSYTFEEVVVVDDMGADRQVGWRVSVTMYLMNNNYEEMLLDLKQVQQDARENGGVLQLAYIELNNGLWNRMTGLTWTVRFWSLSSYVGLAFGLEHVEFRPRIKITLHGFIPLDALDSSFIV